MAKRKRAAKSVESITHQDKRANIPTEELRDFVTTDEAEPDTVSYPGLLYARDPSLDPQLVWKGKDEQDRHPLEVPAVPIYIQEKIHPQVLIDDLRTQSSQADPDEQPGLFDDFNGIEFDELVDFYQHEQNWANRMILGDSLQVMTSLAEKEGLKGQVQMIYIDPPYGIKFGSNWQVSTRTPRVQDGRAQDTTRQPEQVKAFRDTWELGIHSYLSYLRDRLIVARELLTDTGSVFVQIGDENAHLVRCLLDEVFGSEHFVSQISYATTGGFSTSLLSRVGDYLLWYAKDRRSAKYHQLYVDKPSVLDDDRSKYNQLELPDRSRRAVSRDERAGHVHPPPLSRLFRLGDMAGQGSAAEDTPFEFRGRTYRPPPNSHWKAHYPRGLERVARAGRVQPTGRTVSYVRYFDDFPVQAINSTWLDIAGSVQSRAQGKLYSVQTGESVLERCTLMTTDPGDLVLDPTCGSGTTAHVAERWGRRWITIDTSRVALALARARIMAAQHRHYVLSDSPEGVHAEAQATGHRIADGGTAGDIRQGFVYARVPRRTQASIANNEEIDVIHEQWQVTLEPILTDLNRLRGESWEEWQVPREAEAEWSAEARDLLTRWWESCRARQKEIDDSIARNSDTELLYDKPYEDPKRVRVSGPFTVESVSPHRVLSTDEERPASETEHREEGPAQFATTVIDHLRKAGVTNTKKGERLEFGRLDSYAGAWLHAEGEFTDSDGTDRRVAVSIGPEHGTVGPEQVKEAAKEAVRGVGFDVLVVCGFAFDAHVDEETRRYGNLTVLPAKMDMSLAMGDEVLKKTDMGNLFMVFGEPDVEISRDDAGKVIVEIRGLDVYDPTTSQIRSSSTDDIACWFIDTDYNEESFFVRHAYFLGAGDPYGKLKRTLRAEIDEEAWESLHATTSRPFDPPASGKIAVKVINHYGDELLKVYDVA
ncbi:site-specific DNA-methyltransferase [Candidatus Poribacteria bacterium]|nr:site-specific DNA-methyltransferase [Candidatus Poribacteria bacterium]